MVHKQYNSTEGAETMDPTSAVESAQGYLPRLPSDVAKPEFGCARVKRRRRKANTDEVTDISSYQSMWPGGMAYEDEVMNDLEIKMAHIQWRKHANGKSIRRAIDTSKRMGERDLLLQLAVDREGERERWVKAIIRDELANPAEISETFLKDFEQQEEKDRKRQLKETKLHLAGLKRVQRAVKSKGSTSSQLNRRYSTGSIGSAEIGTQQDTPTARREMNENDQALREKLKNLRGGIEQRRKELKRVMRKGEVRTCGDFSATSFKTGRGRC